jgi:cysteine desulfurase / selenocysteine lyase
MTRREFFESGSIALIATLPAHSASAVAMTDDFPVLQQKVNGHPLLYLDTAATAQRPRYVVEALTDFYLHFNANPAGNLHHLARRSYEMYEAARTTTARFIGAMDPLEVVFTRGTTEGINLVASSWGEANIHAGDEVVLTIAEHASNMLPWVLIAKRKGARVRYAEVNDNGELAMESLRSLLNERTRLVAFSHVSNVLGIINPAKEICALAHSAGAKVLIDAAQSAPHIPLDVKDLGCDFLAFSGHKIMGPMGAAILWVKREILDAMLPYQSGSNMAHGGLEDWHYVEGARRFSAGTPNASGAIGLAAAMRYIEQKGWPALWAHEQRLTKRFLSAVRANQRVRLLGDAAADRRISLFSFTVEGKPPVELAKALDQKGIAIRAGDLASAPLLKRYGLDTAARASFYLYNTEAEVDRFAEELESISRGSVSRAALSNPA